MRRRVYRSPICLIRGLYVAYGEPLGRHHGGPLRGSGHLDEVRTVLWQADFCTEPSVSFIAGEDLFMIIRAFAGRFVIPKIKMNLLRMLYFLPVLCQGGSIGLGYA
ncbi:hypothetical protein D1872_272820 [compost metagenome]